MQGVGGRLVVRNARYGQGDRELVVEQIEAGCAGRGSVWVWSAHARGNPNEDAGAPNRPLQPTASRARSGLF